MTRFVDTVADDVTIRISIDDHTTLELSPRDPRRPSARQPFGEPVWIVVCGELEYLDEDDDAAAIAGLTEYLDNEGATTLAASLRNTERASNLNRARGIVDWALPAVAVTGLSEARLRWTTEDECTALLRWTDGGLVIEDRDGTTRTIEVDVRTIRPAGHLTRWPGAEDHVPDPDVEHRLRDLQDRRRAISDGAPYEVSGWYVHKESDGVPLELLAVRRRKMYQRSAAGGGGSDTCVSAATNIEFQAHAVADVTLLLDLIDTFDLALPDDDATRLADVRSRVLAVNDPGWTSPCPTAVYMARPNDPDLRIGAADGDGPRTNTAFEPRKYDPERGRHITTVIPVGVEVAQADFLLHAPEDIDFLLDLLARARAGGNIGRRIQRTAPAVTGGDVAVEFPADRSIGTVGIGVAAPGAEIEQEVPARGVVVIPAGHSIDFTRGDLFRDDDLEYLADLPYGTVNTLRLPGGTGDVALAVVPRIAGIRSIDLEESEVTDEGLAHLAGANDLRRINLSLTGITDEGLVHLSGLKELRYLYLSNTPINGAGLAYLAGLPHLVELLLDRCLHLGDEAVGHLLRLTSLEYVDLSTTAVLEAAARPLFDLPALKRLRVDSVMWR